LDFSTIYQITSQLETKIQYSYLKGDDNSQGIPLIFMPANNIYGALTYDVKNWRLGRSKLENIELQLNNRFVFEQTHILPEQDFIQPPKAYNLIGAKVSLERQAGKFRFNFYARAENILNMVYRDYLNRQRYFADDLGVNIIAGINVKF
jgi:iron complex outermembrane receptor protein